MDPLSWSWIWLCGRDIAWSNHIIWKGLAAIESDLLALEMFHCSFQWSEVSAFVTAVSPEV